MSESSATPPPAAAPPASKGRVFLTRLFSTLLLWSLLAAAFIWKQDWLIVATAALFGLLGSREFFSLVVDASRRAFGVFGFCVCAGYWVTVLAWVLAGRGFPPMALDLAALALAVQGAFLIAYRYPLEGAATLQRLFATLFGVLYTAVFFGFLLRVFFFTAAEGRAGGAFLLLFLIMVTKFSDMGAYAFGVLFGRHKMIPHISPAKSWEGFGGAFVGAFVGACALMALVPEMLSPLTWPHLLWLTPLLCLTGISGDLAESVIKRCAHIKDSGHSLPGIGGILDLTDSLLFTAPVLYFCLRLIAG